MTLEGSTGASESAPNILGAMADALGSLLTPLLVIDVDAARHNIARMVGFAGSGRWRPHIKTVKQRAIVRLLLDAGVRTLKCATLDELWLILDTARAHGSSADVLLAYAPLGPALGGVFELATHAPSSQVRVLADHPGHLEELTARCGGGPGNVTVLLDVDVGMARTGSAADVWHEARAKIAAAGSRVCGLHGYEGHLGWGQRDEANRGYADLVALMAALTPHQAKLMVTSGTHSFHHALACEGLSAGAWHHQVSPGTLVLSDLRSAEAAKLLDLRQAAFVLSRVVSKPLPDRVTLDAGSKALNPDCPAPGCVLVGYPQWIGQTASEEHRPVLGPSSPEHAPRFGEVVALVPEHVCTTVNMFREAFHVHAGEAPRRHPIEAASRTHDARGRVP